MAELETKLDETRRLLRDALTKSDESVRRDLDETRRLLYGAFAARRTKRWELVGTLANALVHHSGIESDPYKVINQLILIVGRDDGRDEEDSLSTCGGALATREWLDADAWLRRTIETITERLDGIRD